MKQRIAFIAALSENRVIGKEGGLPWDLPDDWKNFKKVTAGKAFLMGRGSYQVDKPLLSDHRNIILTSKENIPLCDNCRIAHSIGEGLDLLKKEEEVFVLGGATIFEQMLDKADYLYLTRVHATLEGDAYFPEIDWKNWEQVYSFFHPKDEKHQYAFTFNEYRRKSKS